MDTQCAWCLAEAGEEMGDGSHGICEPHAEQVMSAYRARRAERDEQSSEQTEEETVIAA